MKKEYLTPDVWIFDFAAACMEGPSNPSIYVSSQDSEFQFAPQRRIGGSGPASL